MNNKMKVTGLILAGYMLGRTKKLGMALTVASAVAGSTAVNNREKLMGGVKELAESSPELKSLQEKITGRLADSGKSAAKAMAAKGVDQLSSRLQDQTEKMKSTLDDAAEDLDPSSEEPEDAEDSAAPDEAAEEAETDEAPEPEEPEDSEEPDSGESEGEQEPAAEEEEPKKPARQRSSSKGSSNKTSGAAKSSSTSRKSGTKAASTRKRSTTAKKPSTARKTNKTKEASDE